MLLGDLIHEALASVGVTPERAGRILKNCRCKDRQERLNALHRWLLHDFPTPQERLEALDGLTLEE